MKPKVYKFKDQEVIAVPEVILHSCKGCAYSKSGPCWRKEMDDAGMPSCVDNKIIFKPAP